VTRGDILVAKLCLLEVYGRGTQPLNDLFAITGLAIGATECYRIIIIIIIIISSLKMKCRMKMSEEI